MVWNNTAEKHWATNPNASIASYSASRRKTAPTMTTISTRRPKWTKFMTVFLSTIFLILISVVYLFWLRITPYYRMNPHGSASTYIRAHNGYGQNHRIYISIRHKITMTSAMVISIFFRMFTNCKYKMDRSCIIRCGCAHKSFRFPFRFNDYRIHQRFHYHNSILFIHFHFRGESTWENWKT